MFVNQLLKHGVLCYREDLKKFICGSQSFNIITIDDLKNLVAYLDDHRLSRLGIKAPDFLKYPHAHKTNITGAPVRSILYMALNKEIKNLERQEQQPRVEALNRTFTAKLKSNIW